MQPYISIKDVYSFISQSLNEGWKETKKSVCHLLLAYKKLHPCQSSSYPGICVPTHVKDDICTNRLASMSEIILHIAGYILSDSSGEVPLSLGGD
jgi:hypothetical protein